MTSLSDISGLVSIDMQGVEKLRTQVKNGPDKALKEVAQQFEVLFINMLLKSMREATPKDGALDSDQTRFYSSMLDSQYAQTMSAKGIGLADMMVKQLTRATVTPEELEGLPEGILVPSNSAPATAPITTPASSTPLPANQTQSFVNTVWPHAQAVSQSTGIPAQFMVAQAALETGWGKNEIKRSDGSPSFNVMGIKAGGSWSGPVAETVTTEYVNGVAQRPLRSSVLIAPMKKALKTMQSYSRITRDMRQFWRSRMLLDLHVVFSRRVMQLIRCMQIS